MAESSRTVSNIIIKHKYLVLFVFDCGVIYRSGSENICASVFCCSAPDANKLRTLYINFSDKNQEHLRLPFRYSEKCCIFNQKCEDSGV